MFELDIVKDLAMGGRQFRLDVHAHSRARRVVLYGPSGAGKSLCLRAVAGLLRPDRGRVVVDGAVLFDAAQGVCLPARARGLGFLFQDYALFPHLTVRQNVAFGLHRGWRNPPRTPATAEVENWLQRLGLTDLADMTPAGLSGGQRQRTALARALVNRPRALLLDEPFAALDAALRATLRDELARLLDELDLPLLLISHDPDDLARFGDEVIHLRDGQVHTTESVIGQT